MCYHVNLVKINRHVAEGIISAGTETRTGAANVMEAQLSSPAHTGEIKVLNNHLSTKH